MIVELIISGHGSWHIFTRTLANRVQIIEHDPDDKSGHRVKLIVSDRQTMDDLSRFYYG